MSGRAEFTKAVVSLLGGASDKRVSAGAGLSSRSSFVPRCAPASTAVMGDAGQIPAESVKGTQTVEIFYFESPEARDDTYRLMAGAAQSDGAVYFAEGENWFVVDYSEVGVGTTDPEPLDLSVLSEPLGTRFTEVK